MVRQSQIAEALGVSIMTVSRALKDHPDLAETTKARVVRKAVELGYAKIPALQHKAAPRRVAVLCYSGLFESEVTRAIFDALQQQCRSYRIETTVEILKGDEVPLSVQNRTVGGAFLFGRYTPEVAAHFRGIPTLAVSSFIRGVDLPGIVADNAGGMAEATEHLIAQGHRRILFLGDSEPGTFLHRERAAGYVAAMDRHDLPTATRFCPRLPADLDAVAGDLGGATAVVCSCDGVAYDFWAALDRRGVSVPDDCSLVGFDCLLTYGNGRLTTYAPDWGMLGRLAADLLLFRPQDLQGKSLKVTVPGRLIPKASVRLLPA